MFIAEILDMMTRIMDAPTSSRNVLAVWAGPMAFVYLRDLSDIEVRNIVFDPSY